MNQRDPQQESLRSLVKRIMMKRTLYLNLICFLSIICFALSACRDVRSSSDDDDAGSDVGLDQGRVSDAQVTPDVDVDPSDLDPSDLDPNDLDAADESVDSAFDSALDHALEDEGVIVDEGMGGCQTASDCPPAPSGCAVDCLEGECALTCESNSCQSAEDCPPAPEGCATACSAGECTSHCEAECWPGLPCPDGLVCTSYGRCDDCGCGQDNQPVCGVDEVTYQNECLAQCAGVTISAEGACPTEGCVSHEDCPAGPDRCEVRCLSGSCSLSCPQQCSEEADCASGMICDAGSCVPDPCSCTSESPVCDLDGVTWPSACEARCQGAEIVGLGECRETCQGDGECPLGALCTDGECVSCACEPGFEVCDALERRFPSLCHARCARAEGIHECQAYCQSSQDCEAGERCEAGVCASCDCFRSINPQCDWSGQTWLNPCEAQCSGADIRHAGACEGRECTFDQECELRQACIEGTCQNLDCPDPFSPAVQYIAFEPPACDRLRVKFCDPGMRLFDDQCGCGCVIDDCGCRVDNRWVCGVNGKTYANTCSATCSNVSVAFNRACDTECDLNTYDLDNNPVNGCEYACRPILGGSLDEPDPTYTDTDCDGVDGLASQSIFVAPPPLGDDNNAGTMLSPVASVAQAQTMAVTSGRTYIFLATGHYPEHIDVVAGLNIYGGLVPRGGHWTRHRGVTSTVGTGLIGVIADGINQPTILSNLEVTTSRPGDGESVNAMVIINSDESLVLQDCLVRPAAGRDGQEGRSGDDGFDGAPGERGGAGGIGDGSGWPYAFGGAGGHNLCSVEDLSSNLTESAPGFPRTGFGGSGGSGSRSIGPGEPGEHGGLPGDTQVILIEYGLGGVPSARAGLGDCVFFGSGCNGPSASGGHGADGLSGADGLTGYEVVAPLELRGFFVATPPASDGFSGSRGGGGGGGAGGQGNDCCDPATGHGGNGGGAGGCGGEGGRGGSPGGSSIALVVFGGSPTLTDNVVIGGDAGDGGYGGEGGRGGVGGRGGDDLNRRGREGVGGLGGDGGRGGDGGCGRSGTGGSSHALVLINGADPVMSGNILRVGEAGESLQGSCPANPNGQAEPIFVWSGE